MDFHSLTRRELQTICKKNGIPANITNVAMADALRALKIVQGIDEFATCSETQTAQSSIESPEKSEVMSPIPRTRSVRKKADNETLPKQSVSRTRRSTRISTGRHADQKRSIAPVKMEVQFSEPPSDIRKLGTARESTTRRTYGTRRSTRLARKASEDSKMEGKEIFDTANVELFPANCGDNFETTIKECNRDITEDTESTVSQSDAAEILEEGSEISNYVKMTSDNSGFGIPNAKEEVKTSMTNEQDEVQENGPNEVNTEICCETHEETGLEVEGFDKKPETNVNREVVGQSEEFCGEGDYLTGNGDMVTGDGACIMFVNGVDDQNGETLVPGTCSNIPGDIGLSGGNFDKLPELGSNNEVDGETEDFGEEQDEVNGDKEMVKSDAAYEVVVNGIPDGGNLFPEIGCKFPGETGLYDVIDKQTEIESKDGVIGERGVCSDVTNAVMVDAFVTKSMEEGGEADIVTDAEKELEDEELLSFCDNLLEEEAPMTIEEEAHYEIINSTSAYPKAAGGVIVEHIVAVDESRDDTEAAGEEDEGQEEVFSVSNDDKAAKVQLTQLNEVDYPKEGQENSGGEDASEREIGAACLTKQMTFADEGVFPTIAPLAPTPGKKKSLSTNASLGKENVSEQSWFAKEEQHQIHKNCDLAGWSLRKLRKEFKQLTIANKRDNKGNPVKLDEVLETASRPALQMLPRNQI